MRWFHATHRCGDLNFKRQLFWYVAELQMRMGGFLSALLGLTETQLWTARQETDDFNRGQSPGEPESVTLVGFSPSLTATTSLA